MSEFRRRLMMMYSIRNDEVVPSKYRLVNTSGTSYIQTDIKFSDNIIEIDFEGSTKTSIVYVRGKLGENYYTLASRGNGHYYGASNGATSYTQFYLYGANNRSVWKWTLDGVYTNDTIRITQDRTPQEWYIGTHVGMQYLYRMTVYDSNGEKKHELLPSIDENGNIGLLDSITGMFYGDDSGNNGFTLEGIYE